MEILGILQGWLAKLGPWGDLLLWLVGLSLFFGLLTRFIPCNPGMYWWKDRRAVATDMVYWFIVPLFLGFFRQAMLIAGAVAILGLGDDKEALNDFLLYGYGPLKDMSLWVQAILMLVLSDIILYWIHRFFHTDSAWRFHAIHHSPKVLDWMSTRRFHPVNQLLAFGTADIAMLLMGFSPAALVLLGPFNIAYSALVHANLNWTFGPFNYVMASPVFHRWHHTMPKEGGNRNFAPTFPILDVIFGTYYMPKGRLPEVYGVTDPNFPSGFWAQFMYPFTRKENKRKPVPGEAVT